MSKPDSWPFKKWKHFHDICKLTPEVKRNCLVCNEANGVRLALNKAVNPDGAATRVGERLHTDTKVLSQASIQGDRYVYVIVDEFSHYVWAFLMKTKDEAYDHFRYVVNNLERRDSKFRVVEVRSDNAPELAQGDVQDFCTRNGIMQTFTCAYKPNQNGRAERFNRTLMDIARPALLDLSTPECFFPHAMIYAANLYNRLHSVTIAGKNLTPRQVVLGRDTAPDLDQLHAFGSLCFARIANDQRRTSADPRSQKGLFIGIGDTAKFKFVWLLNEKKLLKSSDVTFLSEPQSKAERHQLLGEYFAVNVDERGHGHGMRSAFGREARELAQARQQDQEANVDAPVASGLHLPYVNDRVADKKELREARKREKKARKAEAARVKAAEAARVKEAEAVRAKEAKAARAKKEEEERVKDAERRFGLGEFGSGEKSEGLSKRAQRALGRQLKGIPSLDFPALHHVMAASADSAEQLETRPHQSRAYGHAATLLTEDWTATEWAASQDKYAYKCVLEQLSSEGYTEFSPAMEDSKGEIAHLHHLSTATASSATTSREDSTTPATVSIPKTFNAMLKLPPDQQERWREAIKAECDSISGKEVMEDLSHEEQKRICRSDEQVLRARWIFALKRNAHGEITKYKARLVVRGDQQAPCTDAEMYGISAPVLSAEAFRMIIAWATARGLPMHQVDVRVAFLHALLEKSVYMRMPPGANDEGSIKKVNKALYGLRQAPAAWNRQIREFLFSKGFENCPTEPSIYIKKGQNGKVSCMIGLYVDDFIIAGDLSAIQEIKEEMALQFDIKDMQEAEHVLGYYLTRDGYNTTRLTQPALTKSLIDSFQDWLHDARPMKSPWIGKDIDSESVDEKLERAGVVMTKEMKKRYRAALGVFQYLANGTRPDLSFTVNRLSRYSHCATTGHWAALIHLLKYLMGTATMGLQFGGDIWNKHKDMQGSSGLKSYSDSSLSDNSDASSTSGYCHFMCDGKLGGALISWASQKQKDAAISTLESEYRGASLATNTAIWMQGILEDMDYPCELPTTLYVDNEPAVGAINRDTITKPIRHLEKHYFNVRKAVHETKRLEVKHCRTGDMLADIFTKGLPGPLHREMMTRLGMTSIE
jgi:hypothetical protein